MNTQHTKTRRRIILLALGLAAMDITKIPAATPVPENVDWVLIELNGKAPVGGDAATLKLNANEKVVSGSTSVNGYGGKYELKDGALKFDSLMTSLRASVDSGSMELEREFLDMLKQVTGWRLAGGKLELLQCEKIVARFAEKALAK